MIAIEPNIRSKYASAFRKARRERIRAVRLESDLWYCARREAQHGRYLIRFKVVPTVNRGEKVFAECRSTDNEPCRGCWKDRMCVHLATVIERGVKYGRKQQKAEAA